MPTSRLRSSAPVVLAVAVLVAADARGQSAPTGFYFGARGAGSFGQIGDTEFSGAPPPTTIQHDSDFVAAAGVVVGKSWTPIGLPLRSEVEYLHRFRFDYDYRYGPPANVVGYENNVSSDSVMLTTLYDFRTSTGVTPYVGLGIGYVRHTSKSKRDPQAMPGTSTERTTTTDNLALGVQVGATIDLAARWGVDLGYRFAWLGEVADGPQLDGAAIAGEPYLAHDLLLTVQYRF
jgi:opacity protein-like surface antigen